MWNDVDLIFTEQSDNENGKALVVRWLERFCLIKKCANLKKEQFRETNMKKMTKKEERAHILKERKKMAEAIGKWARQFKNITQAAKSIGVTREMLSRICSGKVERISMDMLFKIAVKAKVEIIFSAYNEYGRQTVFFSTVEPAEVRSLYKS